MDRDSRRWIIHADDFGETNEITDGIAIAMRAGRVTSTTIMANMPGTDHALTLAANWSAPASFGVHINLCEGRPLTAAASLHDGNGAFFNKRALFMRSVTGRLSLEDLELEIGAQIARIRDAGISISHLDGHKHLHQLPVVREAVVRCAGRFGIQRARVSISKFNDLNKLSPIARIGIGVRNRMSHRSASLFASHGIRSPSGIVDIASIMRAPDRASRALAALGAKLPLEVFCHPGTQAADVEKPGSCSRFDELNYLVSDGFAQLMQALGVQTISYWEL